MEAVSGVSPSGGAAALALDGVTFGYEVGCPVIQGVTGSVAPGELCALIGPNAAGKSTMMRLMLGQLRPWSGSVRVGEDVAHALSAPRLARRVSYVPQRSSVGFAFTVEQVVRLGRYAVGADEGAVGRALEACDLLGVRRRPYPALSVGQQQRVLLARAMAQADGVGVAVLLDEPVTAMDLRHVHQTMGALVGLARRGLAVVVILHDVNLAAAYADTVWLLDGGRVVAGGPWGEVLTPQTLEAVYRVGVESVACGHTGRPQFIVGPAVRRSNTMKRVSGRR